MANPVPWVEEVDHLICFDMNYVTVPTTEQLQTNLIFQCGVSLGLPRDPLHVGCRHIICRRCYKQLPRQRCPICRNRISRRRSLNLRELEDYRKYKVKCKIGGLVCGYQSDPFEMEYHQEDCINTPWIHSPCGHYVGVADVALHLRYHEWE